MDVTITECLPPFIDQDPCSAPSYFVYRIMSYLGQNPNTILIRYEDGTFRILKRREYTVI